MKNFKKLFLTAVVVLSLGFININIAQNSKNEPTDDSKFNKTQLKGNFFSLYFDFLSGNDYSSVIDNFLEKQGDNVNKNGFLFGFGARWEFKVYDKLYIYPGVSGAFGLYTINVQTLLPGVSNTDYYGTYILFPELGVNYYIKDRFYVNLQVSLPSISTDFSDFNNGEGLDFKTSGISKSFALGYRLPFPGGSAGLEIGYCFLPVTYTDNTVAPIVTGSKDFGGLLIKIIVAFDKRRY